MSLGDESFDLVLHRREVNVFTEIPRTLDCQHYYRPLSSNFSTCDALTSEAALQYTVTDVHPIKGVRNVQQIAKLYSDKTLPLVYIVPESIAGFFQKQKILTSKGDEPASTLPKVCQFVAGLRVGVDKSILGKRNLRRP